MSLKFVVNFIVDHLIILLHFVDHLAIQSRQLDSGNFFVLSQIQIFQISIDDVSEILLVLLFRIGVMSKSNDQQLKLEKHDSGISLMNLPIVSSLIENYPSISL